MVVSFLALLVLAFAEHQDSEKIRRFIDAIERNESEERWRLFEELKKAPNTAAGVAELLSERSGLDGVFHWLARLLAQAPIPAEEKTRARILEVLRRSTPPESAARTNEGYRLLVLLEARMKYGDESAISSLGSILNDREVAFPIRLGVNDVLYKGGRGSDALLEFVTDEHVPVSDRIAAAAALARSANTTAIEFLKSTVRGDRPEALALGENDTHELFQGLATAAAVDDEAWRLVVGEGKSGNPLLVRTILGTLAEVAPGLGSEFARIYLADEVSSLSPDYDDAALMAAVSLLTEGDRALLQKILEHVKETDSEGMRSLADSVRAKLALRSMNTSSSKGTTPTPQESHSHAEESRSRSPRPSPSGTATGRTVKILAAVLVVGAILLAILRALRRT